MMSKEQNQTSTDGGRSELTAVVMCEEVKKCIRSCRFYGNSMDGMFCGHPYWDDKGAYANMIISHGVDIPEECPLRTQNVNIVISLANSAT